MSPDHLGQIDDMTDLAPSIRLMARNLVLFAMFLEDCGCPLTDSQRIAVDDALAALGVKFEDAAS